MKELFEKIEQITLPEKIDYLIDTCFFIWIFEHHKEKDFMKFLKEYDCALTSFNVEEFLHIEHRISDEVKVSVRRFLHKNQDIHILNISVHPGNSEEEHKFVKLILPQLDSEEHDPSDAVLLATAIKTGANILTRDKHDIFNVKLKNFLEKYNVEVYNKFI